ncbi:PAS domain-containing sensor histidine kinase [Methanobacterium alcaliphilum]|uniref:PAS domain-containing sensor histidine kinase n=1 Tax=Methanobacterium alcaliphilum TaxID=392018 RepID=UPI00200A22D7|nr:PAS domain S-box protein [Methanobacterium alcaliphilum]MCK9151920.1 PAS domain S-box protein [Methanobacterium alcaliphilum]
MSSFPNTDQIYQFIFESSLEAMLLTAPDGSILKSNSAAQELLGYSEEDLYKIGLLRIFDEEDPNLMVLLKEMKIKGKAKGQLTLIRKNREKFSGYISAQIFHDENGDEITATIIRDLFENKTEMALEKSEKRYHNLFENMLEGYAYCKMLFDEEGQPQDWIYLDVNPAFEKLTGLKNVKGKLVTEIIPKIKELEPELFETYGRVTLTGNSETKELWFKPLRIWLHISVYRPEKEHFVAVFENITERKKIEEKLKFSEKKYRKIFENVQDIFYQTNLDGKIIEISPSIERYCGYKPEYLIGKPVEMVYFDPEDRKELVKEIYQKGEVNDYELQLKGKNNQMIFVSTNAHLMLDSQKNPLGIEGSLRDINDRKNIEIQLNKSLKEKEMLLKEIHHRVKNNLMIISSLLNIQSRYIKDTESQEIFKESQNRARSMAIIHERLYQSVDLKRIDFADYVRTLTNELFRTYTENSNRIKLKLNLELIFLDINEAIPLGLILNELITNCLKHAFPNDMDGEVTIELYENENYFELIVTDNGIGFPEGLDYYNTHSLGLQIVNSLVDQIDGELFMENVSGTRFHVKFY